MDVCIYYIVLSILSEYILCLYDCTFQYVCILVKSQRILEGRILVWRHAALHLSCCHAPKPGQRVLAVGGR